MILKPEDSILCSVIVPVYNVAGEIKRCLDSLLGQTLREIEILCIDDKSTDNSLEILRDYEKKDSRIKIIALEKNCGVSVARNQGLAIASGEYIGFVDPDDFVDPDFYEKLYSCAAETKSDIVKGEAVVEDYDGRTRAFGPKHNEIAKNKLIFHSAFWSAIYRWEFLKKNKIDFPIGIIVNQDIVFLVKCSALANRIDLVSETKYHYIRREGSLDSEIYGKEKLANFIHGINLIIDFIDEHITNPDEYLLLFAVQFRHPLFSLFNRSNSFEGKILLTHEAIKLYNRCKFKEKFNKQFDDGLVQLLSDENEVGLFMRFNQRNHICYHFKMFNFIPLFKVNKWRNSVFMYLFGFIPLLKIKRRDDGVYYLLFCFLPVVRQSSQRLKK
ncbi:glycosyltransferase [Geminisphaera colitermitum]|uniref:glycosyltransferase n=1 Tax=Geminisphaera colitermitum TaxID=1148786 RepID=UPI0012FF3CEE|nr:glycosyltransferase [Geminisphaera colitermitum]